MLPSRSVAEPLAHNGLCLKVVQHRDAEKRKPVHTYEGVLTGICARQGSVDHNNDLWK